MPILGNQGPWIIDLPDYRPVSVNRLLGMHWSKRNKAKKEARELFYAMCLIARVPRATGCRRVSIRIDRPARERHADQDNVYKVILDGLVAIGALKDDGPDHVVYGDYFVNRGRIRTVIKIEDVDQKSRASNFDGRCPFGFRELSNG